MPAMAHILILNGPNLNLLGQREEALYGSLGLASLNELLTEQAKGIGHLATCFQTNSETALIETVQQAPLQDVNFILINAAGLTHTSICLRDALLAIDIPFIEIHMTNITDREPFRQHSYLSDIACGTITGLGFHSYTTALFAADQWLLHNNPTKSGVDEQW